jgi:hypothetical protein
MYLYRTLGAMQDERTKGKCLRRKKRVSGNPIKWEIISKCFSTALSADNLRTSSGAGRVVAVIVDSPIRFARDHHHRPWWIRSLRRRNVSNAS